MAIGAKRVGADRLCTCVNIGFVDGGNFGWVAEVEQVGHHACAGESCCLQHGSHAAVVHQELGAAQHRFKVRIFYLQPV